jgi:hypothetical protein
VNRPLDLFNRCNAPPRFFSHVLKIRRFAGQGELAASAEAELLPRLAWHPSDALSKIRRPWAARRP